MFPEKLAASAFQETSAQFSQKSSKLRAYPKTQILAGATL
jgi:hypothetical protein